MTNEILEKINKITNLLLTNKINYSSRHNKKNRTVSFVSVSDADLMKIILKDSSVNLDDKRQVYSTLTVNY